MSSRVTHAKTKQNLKKIDRTKRKPKSNGKIDTKGMPARDAKAIAKAEKELDDKPRAKQMHLDAPGMAPTVYKDVNEAAEELGDAKERFKSASNVKKNKEAALIFVMKKRGLTHHIDRGLNIEIILEAPDRVKVKQYNHDEDDA